MFAPRITDGPLFQDMTQRRIAGLVAKANGGKVDAETVQAYADANPTKVSADILQAMLAALSSDAPAKGAKGAHGVRALSSALATKTAELEQTFKSAFRQFVIGQTSAVDRLAQKMAARRMRESDEPVPMNMALPGPPGVGKTESIRAMAYAIHGDPNMFIEVNCAKFQKAEDLAALIGAPPGYAGYGKTIDSSPLSPKNIQSRFGEKRPVLILWDEVDKIGGGNAKVQEDFFKILGNFMQTGRFEFLDNCPTTEIPDVINFFTSNSGMESAGGLKDRKALRDHYIKAMKTVLPQHIQSRIGQNFIGYEPLTHTDRMAIAKLKIGKQLKKAEEKTAKDKGYAVRLEVDDKVLELFADITGSDMFGARPLEDLIRDYVGPLIPDVRRRAKAGEVWRLNMMTQFLDSEGVPQDISRQQVNRLKDAFVKGLEQGTAPESLQIPFPIEFNCTNPKRSLHDYEGEVPRTIGAGMYALGGLSLGGQRLFAVNKGGFSDEGELDLNELYVLKPGRTEIEDRFLKVRDVPEELANANTYTQVTQLDDNHALFYAVNTDDEKEEARALCYLCKAKGSGFEFTKVDPPGAAIDWPEMALVGSTLIGGDGVAMLWAGRQQERTDDGWSVNTDPDRMMGEPIQNAAYIFELKTKKWTHIDAAAQTGRIGAASAYHDGKFYLIGGEEIVRDEHQRTDTSQSSSAVDIFDIATRSFSKGPSLPNGVQWATAFTDPTGTLYVLGGQQLRDGGRKTDDTKVMRMLGANGEWLEENIPNKGVNMVVIPHVDGNQLVGPFGADDTFMMYRPSTEIERGD